MLRCVIVDGDVYAFSCFQFFYYLREDGSGLIKASSVNYSKKGWRFHGIQHESDSRNSFVATQRTIASGQPAGDSTDSTNNKGVFEILARNQKVSINPVWIMVGYGICLNATCGGN